MSIIIKEILSEAAGKSRARVMHDGAMLTAEVNGSGAKLKDVLGTSVVVEIGYKSVLFWRRLAEGSADQHGLFQEGDHAIRWVGAVHNVVKLDAGTSIFDAYSQSGPEFIAFDSKDLPGVLPNVGDHIEVVMSGLCFYPCGI